MNYQEDSYKQSFRTRVAEVVDQGVLLEETYFYPAGGGQPGDSGTLETPSNTYEIRNARKQDGRVVHQIKNHSLRKGDEVRATINWPRRYNLMRMHTAAHVISAVLARDEDAQITGNQLGAEESRIDYDLEDYDAKRIASYEKLINEELAKNHAVTTQTLPRVDAEKRLEKLSNLAMGLPQHIKHVRLVAIGELDVQACAGTHVQHTREVGRVTFERAKNKGKHNRRIYFSLSQ